MDLLCLGPFEKSDLLTRLVFMRPLFSGIMIEYLKILDPFKEFFSGGCYWMTELLRMGGWLWGGGKFYDVH